MSRGWQVAAVSLLVGSVVLMFVFAHTPLAIVAAACGGVCGAFLLAEYLA